MVQVGDLVAPAGDRGGRRRRNAFSGMFQFPVYNYVTGRLPFRRGASLGRAAIYRGL